MLAQRLQNLWKRDEESSVLNFSKIFQSFFLNQEQNHHTLIITMNMRVFAKITGNWSLPKPEQRRARKSSASQKESDQDTMHDINKPITLEDLTNPDKN